MTNLRTVKYHQCFEWAVRTPFLRSYAYRSDTFSLLDRKCHFELAFDYMSSLRLKSNKRFQPPLKVTVFSTFGDETILAEHSITGTDTIIWKTTNWHLSGTSVTFHILIHGDSQEDIKGYASTGYQIPEKTLMSSEIIHLQALSRDFSKLLDESSNSDVKITCDGKAFSAHKNVLGVRSGVLSAMLNSDMVEGKSGLVKLEDIEAPIFQEFLRYMYSGTLPKLNAEDAKKYYEVADKYDVRELKDACAEFMTNNLSKRSACDVLVLADQHSDEDFRKSVISYMIENKIPEDDNWWLDFSEKYPILAVQVLNLYIRKTREK